jgi:hypothetical protein
MEKLGTIDLDGSIRALVPCRRCGCVLAGIYPSVGGQPGNKLVCEGCNSFHGWLSPNHPKAILPPPKHAWVPSDDDVIDRGDLF